MLKNSKSNTNINLNKNSQFPPEKRHYPINKNTSKNN